MLKNMVAAITSRGLDVVLGLRNHGGYGGPLIGTAVMPAIALADLGGKLVAAFRNDLKVSFGLMSELQVTDEALWGDIVNGSIGALRWMAAMYAAFLFWLSAP